MADFDCLLCHGPHCTTVADTVRDSADHGVVRCGTCGHVQLYPVPSAADLAAYYQAQTQRRQVHGDIDREAKRRHVQADTARRVALLALAEVVIDVGCGEGFLLDALHARGSEVVGTDLSGTALLLPEPLPAFTDVAMFHVLEHVPSPAAFLAQWWAFVGSAGRLILEVPNQEDWLMAACPAYAAWHYQRAHLHYFTMRSLWQVVHASGMLFRTMQLFGVQRYGRSSAAHWQQYGAPRLEVPIGEWPAATLERTADQLYREEKTATLTCDTLCVVLEK